MFQAKKEGSKQNILVSDFGKCLQDKYQKCNFIGEDCKAKVAKTWKLVQNVKRLTASTFASKFVLRIEFIAEAYCSMSSVGFIHCN